MTYFALILFVAVLGTLIWQRLKTLLTYFQQEEYDNTRYFGAWKAVRLYDLKASGVVLLGLGVAALGLSEDLVLLLLAAGLCAICFQERRYKFKKPLALTERAQRILYVSAGLMIIPVLLCLVWWPLAIIALQMGPVALIIANAALKPMQDRINQAYVDEATQKLARLDPVRIGITGSFGKTTVKHILAEVLEASGPVFYSRGSINTVLGLTRHIRQRLQWGHRYFIAEMGAYGIGSVKRLCDFAQPSYGIITAVGDAHTERFGSVEVIAQAKSELVYEVCKRGGQVVLNADVLKFEPFAKLKSQFPDQIVSVGGDSADIVISSEWIEFGVWAITLKWKDARLPDTHFELPLLGDHNIMNAALAVSLCLLIDPEIAADIPYFTKSVSQIPHRLQKVETPGAALVLDDAYNANEIGFKSAVATTSDLARTRGGRAILVTPGLAELGLEHGPVHERLGHVVNETCDEVYVVNPDRIPSFTHALDAKAVKVHEVASFFEARKQLAPDLKPEDVVLYENDLPDLLEEKRVL